MRAGRPLGLTPPVFTSALSVMAPGRQTCVQRAHGRQASGSCATTTPPHGAL